MFDLIKGFLAGLTFYQSRVLKGMFREGVKLLGVFSVAIWGSLFFEELLLVLNWYLTEAMKRSEGDKTGYSFNKLQRKVFPSNERQGHHQVRECELLGQRDPGSKRGPLLSKLCDLVAFP